ncbi:MAG: hypothetical protein ABI867_03615 [Kofleriaceae bacterium]
MAKVKTQSANEAAHGNASHLLIPALQGAPDELHPPRPFHGGGPQPKIDAPNYVAAVLWIAARAVPFVDADDRPEFDRMVALAKKQVKLGRTDKSLSANLVAASRTKSSKVPLKIASWTCHEAHNWTSRPIYAGGAARPAARQLVALTLKKRGKEAAAALLVEIDALCVHLEALYMLANHDLEPVAAPVHTVWRGVTGDKATAWIVELANGQLALISKIGPRWKLTEGKRDFVLAHLADHQLDGAAAATTD